MPRGVPLSLEVAQLEGLSKVVGGFINPVIEGTGSKLSVLSRSAQEAIDLAARLGPDVFRCHLGGRYTERERNRLGTPEGRGVKYWGRVTSVGLMKEAVGGLLGLEGDFGTQVEFRLGRPALREAALKVLGGRSLLASAADDGLVGIALAVLEPSFGASGLVGIGVDVTTNRARDPIQHAVTEAIYKALFRAHEVKRFAPGMYGQVRQREGVWEISGAMARAARRLRREPKSDDPLPIVVKTTRIEEGIVALAMVPAATLSHDGVIDPLLENVALRTGRSFKGLQNAALRILSYVEVPDLARRIHLASQLIDHKFDESPLGKDRTAIRDGLTLLALLGLDWNEINGLVPGAQDFFINRGYAFIHEGYVPGPAEPTFGYEWGSNKKRGIVSAALPEFHEAMAFGNGQVVYDPLAGPGEDALEIARRHPGVRVLATDLSPENLRAAAIRADAAGIGRSQVAFRLHDVFTGLPVEDNSVDRIVLAGYSTFGFTVTQLRDFFSTLLRKARSGARLWVDFIPFGQSGDGHPHFILLAEAASRVGVDLRPIVFKTGHQAVAYEVMKWER